MFAYGWILLAAFLCGLGLDTALLVGLVPETAPDLRFINVVNIVVWLMVSPLAWLLLRTLRLRYWQPWTTAEEWEAAETRLLRHREHS